MEERGKLTVWEVGRHVDSTISHCTYHRDTHSSNMVDATLQHKRSEKINVRFLKF